RRIALAVGADHAGAGHVHVDAARGERFATVHEQTLARADFLAQGREAALLHLFRARGAALEIPARREADRRLTLERALGILHRDLDRARCDEAVLVPRAHGHAVGAGGFE